MAKLTLHGIRNCDTVKKARAWLDQRGIEYDFHDYKTQGVDRARLEAWCGEVGWEKLLNRSGTTFRKLPAEQVDDLDAGRAMDLMLAQASIIKRPVVTGHSRLLVGFQPELYAAELGAGSLTRR